MSSVASFHHLLGVGSEPTSAQCQLHSSDSQIFVLNFTEAAFSISCKKISSGMRLQLCILELKMKIYAHNCLLERYIFWF